MHWILRERFDDLLAAWRHHHDLRHSDATLHDRWESRVELEAARDQLYRLRRALAPRVDERSNAALTVVCDELGAPVFVPWQDVDRVADGLAYRCACGSEEFVEEASGQASSPSGS